MFFLYLVYMTFYIAISQFGSNRLTLVTFKPPYRSEDELFEIYKRNN